MLQNYWSRIHVLPTQNLRLKAAFDFVENHHGTETIAQIPLKPLFPNLGPICWHGCTVTLPFHFDDKKIEITVSAMENDVRTFPVEIEFGHVEIAIEKRKPAAQFCRVVKGQI